jgi:hypothetical protein
MITTVATDNPWWLQRLTVVSVVCATVTCVTKIDAQELLRAKPAVVVVPNTNWGWYTPYDAIAGRVVAQAELLRASGDAAVDYARAREIHADAVSKEIDNWVDFVKAYWERKSIWEAEMLKRRGTHLGNQKRRNSKTWDRLRNHPEFNRPGIVSGRMLNFLLDRLSGTVLVYGFIKNDVDPAFPELALSAHVLQGLNLREVGVGGEHLVFKADGTTALQVDWWPFALRGEEFTKLRDAFERERRSASREATATGGFSLESLERLDKAFQALAGEFKRRFTKERRLHDPRSFRQFRSADLFLKSLGAEIARLQTTGDADALIGRSGYDPAEHGKTLMSLLTYMARNGVEFAPATPGDEYAYHSVFAMMRDLYVTVADKDSSIRPPASTGRG